MFEIAKNGSGYGAVTTLANFNGFNGAYPGAGLIADAADDLFGPTEGGGADGVGAVFEIARNGSSFGAVTTLATFDGANGANPFAALIVDAAGDLFGTTANGGANDRGSVFEIAKTGSTYGAVRIAHRSGPPRCPPVLGTLSRSDTDRVRKGILRK